jgi:hypothetical protein
MGVPRLNLDDIEQRMVKAVEDGYSALWDGICCDLIAEVKALRIRNFELDTRVRDAISLGQELHRRLATLAEEREVHTDDPWTIHGQAMDDRRADGERSPR